MFPQRITKDEISQLPLRKFEGKVVVVVTHDQLMAALQDIYEHEVLGFDAETKPSFKKGVRYQVSLLQLAIRDKVYLIRLKQTGITQELSDLFANPIIKKVGISIRDDLRSLAKLSLQYQVPFVPDNIIELNDVARQLGVEHEGVKNLTAIFLKFRVSKAQQTSNWENPQLTEKQIRYAATDAWVCLEIYERLASLNYI